MKELRNAKRLSQRELAIKLSLTQQAISSYERGKSLPDILTAKRISEFFGVTLDYLLSTSEQEQIHHPHPHYPSGTIGRVLSFLIIVGISLFFVASLFVYLPNLDISGGLLFTGAAFLFVLVSSITFQIQLGKATKSHNGEPLLVVMVVYAILLPLFYAVLLLAFVGIVNDSIQGGFLFLYLLFAMLAMLSLYFLSLYFFYGIKNGNLEEAKINHQEVKSYLLSKKVYVFFAIFAIITVTIFLVFSGIEAYAARMTYFYPSGSAMGHLALLPYLFAPAYIVFNVLFIKILKRNPNHKMSKTIYVFFLSLFLLGCLGSAIGHTVGIVEHQYYEVFTSEKFASANNLQREVLLQDVERSDLCYKNQSEVREYLPNPTSETETQLGYYLHTDTDSFLIAVTRYDYYFYVDFDKDGNYLSSYYARTNERAG